MPNANDNVTINTGHTLTIPSGQIAGAGTLNDKGTLRNFGTLNMGKYNPTDLYNQTLSYHIRGGLRGINLDANNNLTNALFSMKLSFEDDQTYFDGNIRKQEWKSSLDNVTRSFTYRYDGASRIKAGVYAGNGSENYTLSNVSYDNNGNIKNLIRNGLRTNNSFGIVDNLNYTYNANSNKILKVDDISNETASFTDVSGNDYTYSPDGSLISDANKGISVIEYNYLKLPKKIVKGSTTILNEYDASGKKLKETIGTNVTDYVGNLIYKNNVLYQIGHDEGRIVDGIYEYNIKDHLGNLRVAFRDSLGIAKIVQANSYGIWGEDLTTLSYLKSSWKVDNFKFTGKEELPETGYIDFGARLYDRFVPRFITTDPLNENEYLSEFNTSYTGELNDNGYETNEGTEMEGQNSIRNILKIFSPYSVSAETSAVHYNSSPYTYVLNNPLLFRDLMGLDTTKSKMLPEVQVRGWNPIWLGPALISLGQPLNILKPVGAAGSKPGSSIASYTLSKAIPYNSPLLKQTTRKVASKIIGKQAAKKVGTAIVGRFLGRFVPYVGWALTAKDSWTYRAELGELFQEFHQAVGAGMEIRNELQKDPLTSGR